MLSTHARHAQNLHSGQSWKLIRSHGERFFSQVIVNECNWLPLRVVCILRPYVQHI